jgi:RNA polymerase sigma-70 factor (ECF subfamily)
VSTINASDFEAERPRLVAIATRILGSPADAQDVVQEAWFRVSVATDVTDLPAWLTTVTTRLCIDQLRRRQTRTAFETEAADMFGPESPTVDPEADILVAEQVGSAMQIVLDALVPAERAAFVLHDVFGYPFEEISVVLGRSETAVRQLASRARRKVHGAPEPAVDRIARSRNRAVVEAFLDAAHHGRVANLLTLLAPDAVMHVDPIAHRMGALPVYEGAAAIAARFDGAQGAASATIDGDPGAAWMIAGRVRTAFTFHFEDGLIREIELIADPDVLAGMEVVATGGRA